MTYDNRKTVRKVLIITLLLNLFVMGLKAVVGYWTGSLSLLADALHSVTDSANNVLGLFASKFSSPHPDREHPYGHQKFEAVGALGIAAFLGIACFEILQGAIERIIKGGDLVRISPPELWLLLIVLGVNIFVAFYERKVGHQVGSPILIADAMHTMSDVWVTISVIGGLIGVWLGYQWLDIVLAFPVALLVFWSGWSVLKANLPWLVDQMAIAPEAIHEIATSVPGVLNCHDIASRGILGRQVFIEMHLIVDAPDVKTAHRITENVERLLEERFHPVRILIHVEPPEYRSEQISFN
ncbi:cation diffusion facilitator family transporter [Nostoc sp. HK-01]|uniref:Cation diffusion facilitator family transporter n=2 Tax=Nostocales TaxID=1161 RepID=A0A1Z4GHH3_9CYAN|nr:cation diffusion facilitator family transporter [Nostoc cycadae]BAY16940.1 cation diffusion facilitator family transporter [Anabaenopsis circularis NIES-21]BBD58955.1 cation diffusion facilitator family transporter [Nostoc sp. HK-01]GBE91898.1 cation diffusion facilitator family transporter [Nostoc cycadae WK-1]